MGAGMKCEFEMSCWKFDFDSWWLKSNTVIKHKKWYKQQLPRLASPYLAWCRRESAWGTRVNSQGQREIAPLNQDDYTQHWDVGYGFKSCGRKSAVDLSSIDGFTPMSLVHKVLRESHQLFVDWQNRFCASGTLVMGFQVLAERR